MRTFYRCEVHGDRAMGVALEGELLPFEVEREQEAERRGPWDVVPRSGRVEGPSLRDVR